MTDPETVAAMQSSTISALQAEVAALQAERDALKQVIGRVGAEEHRAKKLAQRYLDNLADAGTSFGVLLSERDAFQAKLAQAVDLLREWERDTGRFTSADLERKRMPDLHARRDAFLADVSE